MVIDTSILAAILFAEPEAQTARDKIEEAAQCFISVASVVELGIVTLNRSPGAGVTPVYDLLTALRIEQVAVTSEQAEIAAEAYQRYGKGRHLAKLNFGDCFSYALAKSLDLPLLYKGEDFGMTDVRVA